MAGNADASDQERFEEPWTAPAGPVPRWVSLAIGGGGALGLVGVVLLWLGRSWAGAVALALGAALVGCGLWGQRPPRAPSPRRGLVLRGRELLFDAATGGELLPVAGLSERFGVTLLANRSRSRVALALTSSQSAFYVGAAVADHERARCHDLLASAFTVASDERALEPAGPDGLPLVLSGEAMARLYEGLVRIDARCEGRVFLTDARGEPVALDGARLVAGHRALDLAAGLDWRGLLFREAAQGGLTIYQGTYVRQGSTEVVFVSLMPALSSPADPGDMLVPPEPLLERAVQRDLALLRESSEEPPPVAQRVAIDRIFMLPIRAALSASPAASSRNSRPRLPRPMA